MDCILPVVASLRSVHGIVAIPALEDRFSYLRLYLYFRRNISILIVFRSLIYFVVNVYFGKLSFFLPATKLVTINCSCSS